ncbi:MAG: substrate-binding domain-containing protein [Ignavibacteria bacterium]|nr:substrate-binding domain-containing protein [Ignavibacteria bacterium]
MKSTIIFYIICFYSLLVSGCKFDEIKSIATTGSMSIDVDENIEPLMKAEITEFERLNPEAKINMKSTPTANAFADLINGDTKLIVVTRNFTEDEKAALLKNKLELKEYPLAVDGIGFIVNVKNPVTRVTSVDLKNIFSGENKLWTDIKSQNEEQNSEAKKFFKGPLNNIKIFIQRKNSATNKYFQDSVLKNLEYSNSAIVCSTSVQMLNSVRENENAIGIISMNWLSKGEQDTIDTTVATLRVSKVRENGIQEDFAEFHQGLLFNEKYPYRRTVYVFCTEQGIQLSTGFITFLLNTDGQKIVLKNSLVPVRTPVRTIQLN